MINIFKKQNGMNIVGQGGKIILFMLPSLISAISIHLYLPKIAALPDSLSFIRPLAIRRRNETIQSGPGFDHPSSRFILVPYRAYLYYDRLREMNPVLVLP